MNVASERAREACEACRKSHKKCKYDDDSTRCLRCTKRNTPCSLFVDTAGASQPGPPTLAPVEPAPDSWAGLETPHGPGSSASSNFSYQFPPQEDYYWPTAPFTGNTQGGYPADMVFPSSAIQHGSEQPAMNQDGLYGHNNVFGDHDGT
ncbi:hypothetical protein OG21DRAFT_1493716 [Imleria badia]|nr:hypothetical protein OG21DRAFT_1493716 [Imleria badia]